jgi:predicted acetyltransferase
MSEYELRPIRGDETEAFGRALAEAFQSDPREEELALWSEFIEPGRTLAAFVGDEMVATSALLSLRIAIPGAVVPMAGVSAVGVHAVHRRRGLLDRMMRAQLEAIRERGTEAIASLWASEAGIYGRYGFGLATRLLELTVRSREASLIGVPEARPRAGAPADLLPAMRAVHGAFLPARPGMISRDARAWKEATIDFEADRDGAGRLRALVADGSGGPEGYALFAVRRRETDKRPDDVVVLHELVATTPAARASLWEHLLRLSLSRSVRWARAPADDELVHMLADPGAVTSRLEDGLFVRLVDLAGALAARVYHAPVDVVLEVGDELCPWNARRWRLAGDQTGATCERSAAPADIALGARELGAAFLGGTTLAALAATGRVEERSAGAVAAASCAFRGPREPWCFEHF